MIKLFLSFLFPLPLPGINCEIFSVLFLRYDDGDIEKRRDEQHPFRIGKRESVLVRFRRTTRDIFRFWERERERERQRETGNSSQLCFLFFARAVNAHGRIIVGRETVKLKIELPPSEEKRIPLDSAREPATRDISRYHDLR